MYFNGHIYQKLIWYNGEVHQPDTSPTYWQDLGADANPFPFRAWGNLDFFDSALPLDQWYFGGGASVVGAGMLKADCHQNHWAEQEADNSGVGQYGLGPTVRMIDSNNFYKLGAIGLDPDYPWFAFQLWRVRNGTYTLLYQPPYNDAVDAYAALKLGVSNDSNGNPVLEMAYRVHGYDPHELEIASYPWVYIGSYTDTSADAIRSGGKPGTWGYYPLTEGTSHWSYGEYEPLSPMVRDPDTTITSSPVNPSNSASASFSFTSTDPGAAFECKLDGGGFTACTSPKSYTGLADGGHTFSVRAKDAAGNSDPTPAAYAWTIIQDQLPDLSGKWKTLTTKPRGNQISGSLQLTNSGSTSAGLFAVTYYLSEDGVNLSGQLSSQTVMGLKAGKSISLSFSYNASTPLTNKYIIAAIDSGGAVAETNENNNMAVRIVP